MNSKRPKRVSLQDVAQRCNCTAATVSYALNGTHALPEATRERILRAATELGYVSNRFGKLLQSGRTSVLGVIVPFSCDPFYSVFLDDLAEEALEKGYQLEIHFHRWSQEEERRLLTLLVESRVEGIVLFPTHRSYHGTSLGDWMEGLRTPILAVNPITSGDVPSPFFSSVELNLRRGGFLLGSHLAQLGHRKIDLVQPSAKPDRRLAGIREGLARFGSGAQVTPRDITLEENLETGDFKSHGLSSRHFSRILNATVARYLDSSTGATAVVASNELVACKLLAACHARGIRCPDDLSVVCYSPRDVAADSAIPLTAVEYDIEALARNAVTALLDQIAGNPAVAPFRLSPELVERASTTALAHSLRN